jgi:DNA-binding transcriptional regulator YhcF (GntR family)
MFDERSPMPIYRQIADQIKAQVLDGSLQGDAQVMSTNEYATFYRINPATAAKAFQLLVDDGILYKKRGIGMFVASDARQTLQREHRERFFTDVVERMAAEARAIDIPIRDIIRHLEALENEVER